MQEQEERKILNSIISSITNGNGSFSYSLLYLKNKDSNLLNIIDKYSRDLALAAGIYKGVACDTIGLNRNEERKSFIHLAEKINTHVIKKTAPLVLIRKLNEVFKNDQINIISNEGNIAKVMKIIEEINLLSKVQTLLHVLDCWPEFTEVLPYCKRYVQMGEKDITKEISELVFAHTDLEILILDRREAKKCAIEALIKAGHAKDTLETKTAGALLTIVERMVTAGNAVMECKKIKPNSLPSKGDMLDQIANYWLKEEMISAQNKTDFIIPPPD